MRDIIRSASVYASALLPLVSNGMSSCVKPPERPNLIFILVDDMGYSDPGFMGGDIDTPNLNRLAEQGTVFTRFYNHGKCEPSRASLMTGVHYHRQTYDHVVRKFRGVSTIAAELKSAGYYTACAGKWHIPDQPTDHGFDRCFGFMGGAANHMDPDGKLGLDEKLYLFKGAYRLDGKPFSVESKSFYSADADTDYALRFLEDCPDGKPFFLYLAYRTPHWPLQAPEEDIKKYEHRYDAGWDILRQKRYANMVKNGIIDPQTCKLSLRDPDVGPWDAWTNKADSARCMEVHAAMIDRTDQQIGRLLDWLESHGKLNNTLICFASDNGISGDTTLDRTPEKFAGPVDSFRLIPRGFSTAANTPLVKYKLWNSNGGICSPLVVHWPGKVPAGKIEKRPVNLLDVMPTFLDAAGASYPENLRPLDGRSVLPLFLGSETFDSAPMFFHLKYGKVDQKAVVDGPWKAWFDAANGWKLFNLDRDFSETEDVAGMYPEILQRLISEYDRFNSAALKDQQTYGQGKESK